ncbi:MAG: hypothetical protein RR318_07745 [Alistipes sp.]
MIIIKYYETCPFVTDKCSWKYEKIRTPGDSRDGVRLTKRKARKIIILTKREALKIIQENKMVLAVKNQYGEVWEVA